MVGKWAYIKELAMTNRGIKSIRLYVKEKCSKGEREGSVHR